jgi:hypothetical protein
MSRELLTVRQLRNARQIPSRRDASDVVASLPALALAACYRVTACILARLIDAVIHSVIS